MGDPTILTGPRLPIKYTEFKEALINPFYADLGKEEIEEQIFRIFDNNLTFAVYNLFKWKNEPLELAPFQSVIIQMLWEKTFPMLLMTRGGGKCVRNSHIWTDSGIFLLDDNYRNDKRLWGENGYHMPFCAVKNPPQELIKITTRWGYSIEGTPEHPIRIMNKDGEIEWRRLDSIRPGDISIISRDGNYSFNGPFDSMNPDVAYSLGALVGDGCFVINAGIGFTNLDKEIVTNVRDVVPLLWQNAYWVESQRKGQYFIRFGNQKNKLAFMTYFGLREVKAKDKDVPNSILQSNKKCLANFLAGLFDTDGTVDSRRVSLCTVSKKMAEQVQICLLSFGIISRIREKNVKYKQQLRRKAFEIIIEGSSLVEFNKYIRLRCSKKSEKISAILDDRKFNTNYDTIKNIDKKLYALIREFQKTNTNLGCLRRKLCKSAIKAYDYSYPKIKSILDDCPSNIKETVEYQKILDIYKRHYFYDAVSKIENTYGETYDVSFNEEDHSFITNGFISHNTFLLAVYSLLRAMMVPGSQIVIVAASFRQSKLVFDYITRILDYSPLVRESLDWVKRENDMHKLSIGKGMSTITALPLGDGEKIRGIRASDVVVDEFASVPEEVLNVVIRGFASVSADPVRSAKMIQSEDELIKAGKLDPSQKRRRKGNKIVMAGTASYQFNHFYRTYRLYRAILEKRFVGDSKIISSEAGIDVDVDSSIQIDYRDYAIIQIPYSAMPKGFMDEKQIAQARASMPKAQFSMEYECQFPTDSDGFFKRSAINEATPGISDTCGMAPFNLELVGEPGFEYVMGIDPARKSDNFAISVLKLLPDGRYKNVYCWALNNKSFIICVKKIRDLLHKFNIVRIAMDAGGGGNAVMDLLQSAENAGPNDLPIWLYNDKETAMMNGRHILDMVNFTSSWIADANYGMAADIEHQRLLFPFRTLRSGTNSEEEDEVWDNINEQINETCMIVVTPTKTGVQHFDLPDVEQVEGMKTVQRKDRYSAILLASYAARTYLSEKTMREVAIFPGDWVDAFGPMGYY